MFRIPPPAPFDVSKHCLSNNYHNNNNNYHNNNYHNNNSNNSNNSNNMNQTDPISWSLILVSSKTYVLN